MMRLLVALSVVAAVPTAGSSILARPEALEEQDETPETAGGDPQTPLEASPPEASAATEPETLDEAADSPILPGSPSGPTSEDS